MSESEPNPYELAKLRDERFKNYSIGDIVCVRRTRGSEFGKIIESAIQWLCTELPKPKPAADGQVAPPAKSGTVYLSKTLPPLYCHW